MQPCMHVGINGGEATMAIPRIDQNIMQQSPLQSLKKNTSETTTNYENKNQKENTIVENKGLKIDTKA